MVNRIIASSYPIGRIGRGLYLSPDDGGGAGGGTGEGGTGGGEGSKSDDVTFTPAQIAKIGEINAKERNAAKAAGEKAARESFLSELGVKDLDELKAKLTAKPETGKTGDKADDDAKLAEILARRDGEWKPKLDSVTAERDAAVKALADMKAARITDAKTTRLMDAGARAGVNPKALAEVAQLVSPFVTVTEQDGKFVYSIAGEGGPALNAKGDPMTPDEFVAAWVAERPWYGAPSGTTGSGSKPNTGTNQPKDLTAQIAEAQKAGDQVRVVALKRQLAAQAAT